MGSTTPTITTHDVRVSSSSPLNNTTSPNSLPSIDPPIPPVSSAPTTAPSLHPMQTRLQNNILCPKQYTDGIVPYSGQALTRNAPTPVEPTCFTTTNKDTAWQRAMNEEFDALLRNHIWSLVLATSSMNVIGNKWVYCLEYNADDIVQCHKARLVSKGFHQQPGLDYGKKFSLVVKSQTIRLILYIVVARHWPIRQFNVSNTFLHGDLSEVIFMAKPQGFIHPQYSHHVCKLHKAIYGHKQAHAHGISRSVTIFFNLDFWLLKLTVLSSHKLPTFTRALCSHVCR